MAQNFKQEGKRVKYTNGTGSDIASGAVVVIGALLGIALVDIADTESGEVALEGVWELPKTNPLAISQGDQLFWNTSTKKVTKTATDKQIGVAFAAAGSTDDVVDVKLYEVGDGVPVAATVAALGTTTNLTAIAGVFADLAAARTAVNTLATETEARLDAIEAKVDSILTSLKNAGLMS